MSITNINGSYSSSAVSGAGSSRKGISGLASGLNTDEIIESLTSGTQGKITKLQQSQQKLVWQTEAYRSITDKLVGFSKKYLSSSSPTYMMNSKFFENATIRSLGANAGAVSVKGSSSSIKNFQVNAIRKLATTAGFTAAQKVSSQKITTEDLTADMFADGKAISKLEGESINVTYNHTRYDIHLNNIKLPTLSSDDKLAIKQFNEAFTTKYKELVDGGVEEKQAHGDAIKFAKEQPLNGGTGAGTLGDMIATKTDEVRTNVLNAINEGIEKAGLKGKVKAVYNAANNTMGLQVQDDGNTKTDATLIISGIGRNTANYLGIDPGSNASEGQTVSGQTDLSDGTSVIGALDVRNMKESLAGHSFVFDLDGVKKTITFDDFEGKDQITFADVEKDLKAKIDRAFGGKVKVDTINTVVDGKTKSHFEFTAKEATSILSVASGDNQVTGTNGGLGLKVGAANRLLLDEPLESLVGNNTSTDLSGVLGKLPTAGFLYDDKGTLTEITNTGTAPATLNINGTKIELFSNAIRVTGTDGKVHNTRIDNGITMRNLMDTVNNSDAGVTMKYNSTTDNFTVTAKDSGSYGKAEVKGALVLDASGNPVLDSSGNPTYEKTTGLVNALFGGLTAEQQEKGQDAELEVSFDGGKTSTTITRSSNTFSLNGMNLTLNSVFNENVKPEPDGTVKYDDPVKFDADMNTEGIVKNIKEMVSDYNDIVKLVNGQFSTKPDKKYAPLTDAQRKQLSADEIKNWDEKAKQGVLFNDSELGGLASDIRFAFSLPVGGNSLRSIGISTSANWEDNGMLTLDETALEKALQERPDDVMDLFAKKDTGHSDGGAMTRVKSVLDKYAATTGEKGILIKKAGNSASPLSMMDNAMQTRMDDIDKQIKNMQSQLKVEQDRYYSQFSNLEVYINKMNAQSGWLQQQNS